MTDPLTEYQNHLIETHIGLAKHEAAIFWKRLSSTVDYDDVVSIAYQGLVTAAQRFDVSFVPGDDPDYDPFLAFGSFARIRITGAIRDWLRTIDHVPRRQRRTYRDIQELSPGRTPDEVAAILGIDVTKVRAITCAVQSPPVSLFDVEDGSELRYSVGASTLNTEDSAMTRTVQQAVVNTIDDLPELERSVIVLRYYVGLDFSRIAAELEMSPSVVKTAHQGAVELLHNAMMRAVAP